MGVAPQARPRQVQDTGATPDEEAGGILRIGILGTGMGRALSTLFSGSGHDLFFGSREPARAASMASEGETAIGRRALRGGAQRVAMLASPFLMAKGHRRFFVRVYEAVRAVPRGRVVTYGQLARLLGVPQGARAVGWALRALPPSLGAVVPWHRVVGHGGRISLRAGDGALRQRRRLKDEGVRFRGDRVDMGRHSLLP